MSDRAFDARFESLLREALNAEASSLPLRVTRDQIVERANVRYGAHVGARFRRRGLGQPSTGLRRLSMAVAASAAAVVIVVAGVIGLNLFVSQQGMGAPSPNLSPSPTTEPSVDLGIFEPVAGRIVYHDDASLWALDPKAPAPVSTLVRLGADETADQFASFTVPLGWSSDGTKLLFLRANPNPPDRQPPFENLLYILHADGTETQITPGPVRNAAISPDGSRVAFSTRDVPGRISPLPEGLYVVDAEGGEPVRIAEEGTSPTFSPDGTRIAYLSSPPGVTVYGVTGSAPVWVVTVDGTDAHEILTDEPGVADVDFKQIKWSPAGDRIAMYRRVGGQEESGAIYTFAPDGSDFTMVVTGGYNHHWSPDGSQIAYSCLSEDDCALTIADADGSNVRTFEAGAPGPWHPGALRSESEGSQ